jgi:hypothetical protein
MPRAPNASAAAVRFFSPVLLALTAVGLGTLLAGCGSSPDSPAADRVAADSAAADSADEDAAVERRTRALARRLAARTDSAFAAVEPLTAAEKRRLRRYLQPQHIEQARRLGLDPVRDRRAAAGLGRGADSTAVRLSTNSFYIVDPAMSYAVALAVPSTAHVLRRLGRRFQENLMARELPPYRFILTNILRTGQDQAAISGISVNAAQGQSTHEYGTTFDVFYEWFHYAAAHDTPRAPGARPDSARAAIDETLLRRLLYAAYRQDGDVHARKIKAVLGRSILELQEEGRLLATYERQEPVFHLTVARRVEAPSGRFTPFSPAADSPASS